MMSLVSRYLVIASVTSALVGFSQVAWAGPLFFTNVRGQLLLPGFACGSCGGTPSAGFDVTDPVFSSADVSGRSPRGFVPTEGNLIASAELSSGELRAAALVTDDPASTFNRFASGVASASFGDVLTFDHTPDGLPWMVGINVQIDGVAEGIYSASFNARLVDFIHPQANLLYTANSSSPNNVFSRLLTHQIVLPADRSTIDVTVAATLSVGVHLSNNSPHRSSANYGNTAEFQLDLPPDVTFSSASGVFLQQGEPAPEPVPEPGSLLMLGTGLVGLVVRRLARPRNI